MNNYGWNLDNDYICHSPSQRGAHYSKNWNAQKQNEYNKWYYQNVTKKKSINENLEETGKHLDNIQKNAEYLAEKTGNFNKRLGIESSRNKKTDFTPAIEEEMYDEYGSRTSDPKKAVNQQDEFGKSISDSLKKVGSTIAKTADSVLGNKIVKTLLSMTGSGRLLYKSASQARNK